MRFYSKTVLVTLIWLAIPVQACGQSPPLLHDLTSLNQLIDDFNKSGESIRLVLLLSPT